MIDEHHTASIQTLPEGKNDPLSEYCWIDTALGDIRNRNKVMRVNEITLPDPSRECYTGMFRFREEYRVLVEKTGSVKGVAEMPCYGDCLWFDIDRDDVEKARGAAMDLLSSLENKYDLKPNIVGIFFSGAKGCHIGIPSVVFGGQPSVTLPLVMKLMAAELAGEIEIDKTIYEKNRLWRLPNSINGKSGLFKIALTYDELCQLSADEIKKLAIKPREPNREPVDNIVTPIEPLRKLYKRICDQVGRPRLVSPLGNLDKYNNDKPCIARILAGVETGRRNEAACRLVDHFKKTGDSLDQIREKILTWNERNSSPLPPDELDRAIESIYQGQYDYGCKDEILSAYCDTGCPYYTPGDNPEDVELVPFKFFMASPAPGPIGDIIITEGSESCQRISQLGFPAIGFEMVDQSAEQVPEIIQKADIVYLFSRDPQRLYPLGALLGEKSRIVQIQDNEWDSAEKLRQMLDGARGYVEYRLDRISQLPEHRRRPELQKLLPYLTTADNYSQPYYIEEIKKRFKISKRVIDDWLKQCQIDIACHGFEGEEPEPEFTEEELQQAKELLEYSDLLDRFLKDTERTGCVGEEDNKLTIYLALTSRLLDDPINLIIKGESSGGKSFQVQTVTKFFPEGDILEYTALTPKALYHRKDDLEHKGLVVYERHGAEESDYSIRTLQSEKKLILSTVVKNPSTNEQETVDIEVKGPIAYIETTTATHIHAENETRCFEIYIDESEEQTKKIFEAQQIKYRVGKCDEDAILRPWQAVQRLLKPVLVTIPFIDLIEFPTKPVRVRRDHNRFLALIEVSAFIHQKQRKRVTIDSVEYIEADIQDYEIACRLAGRILSQTIKAIVPKTEELIRAAADFRQPSGEDETFTRQDMMEKLGWAGSTTRRCLKDAANAGYIELVESTRGKAYRYQFKSFPDPHANILLSPEELQYKLEESKK